MIVNSMNLTNIKVGFKTLFNKAFSNTTTLWEKVATRVPSENGEESYKWLGMLPKMRKWVGEREIQNLSAFDYTIKNEDFELTIGVDRNEIEDDRVGLYNPVITDMGQSAKEFPDTLVFGLLKDGFTQKCYDGQPFFSGNHKVGKVKVGNMSEKVLSYESYLAGRTSIMNRKTADGVSLKLVPDLLVVPPALESKGKKILKAEKTADGATNICKDTAELLVVPELAGADTQWYLLCTTKSIKPILYQERKAAKFISFTNEKDSNVFLNKNFLYGTDARCNVGFGFWQMAFGSKGTQE